MTTKTPAGLSTGGRALWKAITNLHELSPAQTVQLLEACRAKDRLDKLDEVLRGEIDVWARLVHDLRTEDYELKIDGALSAANATANLMKQLLAAMRLPDEVTGRKPQQRGGARGAYAKDAKVSSLDRARQAKSGT